MNAFRDALALGVLLAAWPPAPAQETTRVSVDSFGAQAAGDSMGPTISADGRFVAFQSMALNLVSGDTNSNWDVFVHDLSTGVTERVSVDSFGVEGNSSSFSDGPSVSADGRFVAFGSVAWNLVLGDTNGVADIFVHDRLTGTTERVSVDSSGDEANAACDIARVSADGRFVAFHTPASILVLGDTNGASDVFLHDLTTGATVRVSVDSSGTEGDAASGGPSISSDGRYIAFGSDATNLVSGDTNGAPDAFVHDRTTGVTERVSLDSSGLEGNGGSFPGAISADGRFVEFHSLASNLVPGDTNGVLDVFVCDRATDLVDRVSVASSGAEANAGSAGYAISLDGRYAVFFSDASNLVAGDANNATDIFVHDRLSGLTERISVDSSGAEGNGTSSGVLGISGDGSVVAFQSWASNLVANDSNGAYDIFTRNRCVTDASWTNYGAGFPGTNGVPSFTAESNPVLGSSVTLDLANSSGTFTVGLLFIGFQQTSIHSKLGGDLLVLPAITTVVGLPPSGMSLMGAIPNDGALCGLEIDLQAMEADAGAAKGVSFTQGLELVLGH